MRILAHRGASGYAPENTFAAFDLACDMQADAIETDVRLTRDGVLVLFHDETVDRVTDASGPLSSFTFEQIQRLDAAAKFEPRHPPQRIPRLDEFLLRYIRRIPACLEIKTLSVVEPLVCLLGQHALAACGNLELTTFEWEIITALRAALPDLCIGWLMRDFTRAGIEQAVQAKLNKVCPSVKQITPELVALAHTYGLGVRLWGVKTREDLARAHSFGIDGTTLNWPDWYERKKVS